MNEKMRIEVWSDFVCPFCYVGKRKLEKALKAFPNHENIEVVYKAYELDPRSPQVPTNIGYEAFAESKGISIEKAKEMYQGIIEHAKNYGLDYNIDKTIRVSTLKAHRLAKWARTFNKEHEFTEIVMNYYFTQGKNINDNKTLLEVVASLGLQVDEAVKVLESEAFLDEVKYEKFEGVQVGVQGVPFFVFDNKYGISGAQPDELFDQTIAQAYRERSKPLVLNPVESEADGGICGPDDNC